MKQTISILCVLLMGLPIPLFSQHTFSILAIDTSTGEIGSAGATCLDSIMLKGEMGALVISDIIPGKGVIHTQAEWLPVNQKNAQLRMEVGDSPKEIIEWLVRHDAGKDGKTIKNRQYGIVKIHNGSVVAAAYTGKKNPQYANHLLGSNYCVIGNTLLEEDVLTDMERAFIETEGSLAEKLMAALQGAKRLGTDSRCAPKGVSCLSAFIRVARPTESDSSYGKLSLDINIDPAPEGSDPIDLLQKSFNDWKSKN